MEEAWEFAVMSWIKITESDFLPAKTKLYFVENLLCYTKPHATPKKISFDWKNIQKIEFEKDVGLNIAGFGNPILFVISVILMGFLPIVGIPLFAAIICHSVYKSSQAKRRFPFTVKLSNKNYVSAVTNMTTYFEIQNAWLDSKAENNAISDD